MKPKSNIPIKITSKESFQDQINDKSHVRKLRCKNGEFKFIQWKNKQFSNDLIIGIGQDISNEIQIQNQYKDLIENAQDFIYEIDFEGKIIFINNYTLTALGYEKSEFLNQHYSNFIRKDYIDILNGFYNKISEKELEFPMLEIPFLKKNGQTLWVAQKIHFFHSLMLLKYNY